MESPENANVAAEAGETSPARSLRRWQFTIAEMLILTAVCAAVLSIGTVVGWEVL